MPIHSPSACLCFLSVYLVKYSQSVEEYEVIVGGAGASGLSAVYTLQKEGLITNYAILEGKDDVGGKVKAIDFGLNKDFSVETGAGYISGGVDNPFYCQMEKLEPKYKGFNVNGKYQVNNLEGEAVLGNYDEDWDYDWINYPEPENAAQRMVLAHDEASWYGPNCLFPEMYNQLSKKEKKWCNALCSIDLTEMVTENGGILDLVETDNNICDNTGVFTPRDDLDMSVTDLMRVGGFFAKGDPDGTCVARVVEYIYHDKESAAAPWEISARDTFYSYNLMWSEDPEFGAYRDYYVTDKRNYAYLLKAKVSDVLQTSKNTDEEVIIDDERLHLSSKITKVKWDPQGKQDVVVTYCKTRKQSEFDYPCDDNERIDVIAKEFISTFSLGVLKKSMELERNPIFNQDDVAPLFDPPLSSNELLLKTLDRREMGTLTKVFLQFSCNFWGDKETYFLPYNKDGFQCDFIPLAYSLDGNGDLVGSNILALATAGLRAEELSNLADSSNRETVYEQVLPLLNQHFKDGIQSCGLTELTVDDILDMFVTDWYNDPQSRGCWLTLPIKTSYEQEFDFTNIGNLFFSGEGTCERHIGWVPGGWFSGERTAKILLKERKDGFEGLDTRTLCDVGKDEMQFNKRTCEWKPRSVTKKTQIKRRKRMRVTEKTMLRNRKNRIRINRKRSFILLEKNQN